LSRIGPNALTVNVATYQLDDGRTCFNLYMSSETLDQYTVLISDTNGTAPVHVFFQGRLPAIPEAHQ